MTKAKRILTIILFLALVITIGGELFLALSVRTSAAEAVQSYDNTPIESDIENMEEADYPASSLGKCSVIGFMEYCFSNNEAYSDVYGLYVYIYNPTEKPIVQNEGYNQISLSTAFGSDGKARAYGNFKLTFLDHTDNHRFYKFKVTDSKTQYSIAKNYAFLYGVRRYEITSLDVHFVGEANKADSVGISKIYEFSGYAAYCGDPPIAVSTLKCQDYGKQSIHLKVYDTHYRFAEKSANLYDDLQSVYFSVPNDYMAQWGDLFEITAEWYQYKTSPMFVTSDGEAYSALYELINKRINEYGKLIDENGNVLDETVQTNWRVLWEEYDEYMGDGYYWHAFYNSYNPLCKNDFLGTEYSVISPADSLKKLDWLFPVENVTSNDDYVIPSEKVRTYIEWYTNKFSSQEKLHGKYAVDLFEREEGDGYKGETFNINGEQKYLDSVKDQSWWNEFWFGVQIEEFNCSPIVTISQGDFYLSPDAFSEKYLVNKEDVSKIIRFAKESYGKNETPILLRFTVNDYYASKARFDFAETDSFKMSDVDGYVAQEMVYLDFDILSLSFSKDGGYTKEVIGVVANSIDIINGLTAPEGTYEEQEWWQKIMAALTIIIIGMIIFVFWGPVKLVLSLLWTGLKFLLSIVLGIIKIPFKIIGWLLKAK